MTAKAKTKVVTLPTPAGTEMSVHPGAMIQALMQLPDLPVDKLEKMFEIQLAYEANEARKNYHTAMAVFGSLVPPLTYDSWVNYPGKDGKAPTEYGFTSLAGSLIKVQEAMTQAQMKTSWKTKILEGNLIEVTCFITHATGHSEQTSLSALPDPSGGKNSIQAVKSTVSYLKRITFEALAGLATKADDADDGRNAGPVVANISTNQLKSLTTKIAKVGADTKKLLVLFKVETLADLKVDQYKPVHALLAAKAAVDKNAEANK
jgi:hypothetical protein